MLRCGCRSPCFSRRNHGRERTGRQSGAREELPVSLGHVDAAGRGGGARPTDSGRPTRQVQRLRRRPSRKVGDNMALNIDWMWLIIGIVLGMFVVPTVLK